MFQHLLFLHAPGEPPIPWDTWIRTFDNYLLAVGLDSSTNEDRCKALLISCLGSEGQRILYTFDDSCVKNLADLKNVMRQYFVGSTSKWTHRLKFNERKQNQNETIEGFASDLRHIASRCDFEAAPDPLGESLLGQFIIGVLDNRIREKLLLKDDSKLTFQETVEIAREYERVSQDSSTLRKQASDNVYQVRSRPREKDFHFEKNKHIPRKNSSKKQCFRCGSENHVASFERCPARNKICNSCQK